MLPIYVINLKVQPDRWDRARNQLDAAGLCYSRFEAVDGWELSQEQINRHYRSGRFRKWTFTLTRPEIGCYLSHLYLWKEFMATGEPGCFVLEDDFIAADDLGDVLGALSSVEFNGPVIVKLYSDVPDQYCDYAWPLTGHHRIATPAYMPMGTVGYFINRAAARRLVERRRTFSAPVDEDLRSPWKTGINIAMVQPTPIGHVRADSTIMPVRAAARALEQATPSQLRHRCYVWRNRFYRVWKRHTGARARLVKNLRGHRARGDFRVIPLSCWIG